MSLIHVPTIGERHPAIQAATCAQNDRSLSQLRHPERRRGGKSPLPGIFNPSAVEGPSPSRRLIVATKLIRDEKRQPTRLARQYLGACHHFLIRKPGPSTQTRRSSPIKSSFPLVFAQDDGTARKCLVLLLGLLTLIPTSAQTVTATNFAKAGKYSLSHGGLALRVEQGGKLIDESYAPGFSASTPHKIYSGTKSFVAVGALIAMQEGLLALDEKASDTLTEWRGDRRRAITINQLLSQTSGLDPDGDLIYPYRDQLAAAVNVHLIDPPGTRFHYGAVGYQAFGEILRRKLRTQDRSVEGWLKDKIFDPLDIDIADWKHDDAGNPLIHSGISLSTEEWAKFGNFINRVRTGKQNGLVTASSLAMLFIGHQANPAYGLGFWLNRPPPEPRLQPITQLQLAIDGDQLYPGGPRDLVAAIGSEKQRLYMIPSLDLVIVRFGQETAFSDGEFLSRLLTGRPHPDEHTH